MGHKKASGLNSQKVKFIPNNIDANNYLDFEYGYFISIAEFMARLKISPLKQASGAFAEITTTLSAFDKNQYNFMTLSDMGEPCFPTFLKKMDKVIKGFHSGSVNLLFCHKRDQHRLMYFVKYLMLMAQHEKGLQSKKVVCIDTTTYPFYRTMLTFVNNYKLFTFEHIKNIFFINVMNLHQLNDAIDGLKGIIETYQPKLVVITSPFASIRKKHPVKEYLIPYEVETTSKRSTEAARLVRKIKKIARNTGTIFLLTHYVNWYKVFKTKKPYLYNSVIFDSSIFLEKDRDNALKLHITHVRQKDATCKIKLDTNRKRLQLKDICYDSILKGTKVIRNNITLKYPELAYCMEGYNKYGVKFVIFKFKENVREVHKLRNTLKINRSLDIVIWADDSVSIYNLAPDSINLAAFQHFGGILNEQIMMINGKSRKVHWIRMYQVLYRKFFESFEEFFLHFLNMNLTNPNQKYKYILSIITRITPEFLKILDNETHEDELQRKLLEYRDKIKGNWDNNFHFGDFKKKLTKHDKRRLIQQLINVFTQKNFQNPSLREKWFSFLSNLAIYYGLKFIKDFILGAVASLKSFNKKPNARNFKRIFRGSLKYAHGKEFMGLKN